MLRTNPRSNLTLGLFQQNRRVKCLQATLPWDSVSNSAEERTLRGQALASPLPQLSLCLCFCFPPSPLHPPLFPSLLGWGLLNYHFSALLMHSLLWGGIIILEDD